MARLEINGVDHPEPKVTVVLSKRNLLALLHKVDWDESEKTLVNNCITIDGVPAPAGLYFTIKCEQDDLHYSNRPAAGKMCIETESFIAKGEV